MTKKPVTIEETDEQEEDMDDLYEAMKKAKKAFSAHFEAQGLEGAYFTFEMRGFILDSDFKRWKTLIMKDTE